MDKFDEMAQSYWRLRHHAIGGYAEYPALSDLLRRVDAAARKDERERCAKGERITGRTMRMVEAARESAKCGGTVLILVANQQDRIRIGRMVKDVLNIEVATIDARPVGRTFVACYADHFAKEMEWERFFAPWQAQVRALSDPQPTAPPSAKP